MKLWSMPSSGNSYKVRLLLALLGRDCEIVDVEDVPLAYLPGNATRVRVKAVGELHVGGAKNAA